jgi:hypothetical protein
VVLGEREEKFQNNPRISEEFRRSFREVFENKLRSFEGVLAE